MSRRLGVPATQHAFEDVALQFQAMKMNLDPEVSQDPDTDPRVLVFRALDMFSEHVVCRVHIRAS